MSVTLRREQDVSLDEVLEVFESSRLGERRPVDDREIVRDMLRHGNLIVTARMDGQLVGFARTLTDFTYVGYLSDLAVAEGHQRKGIGKALIRETRDHMGPRSMLVLLAAPAAREYYPQVGFSPAASAWILRADDPLL